MRYATGLLVLLLGCVTDPVKDTPIAPPPVYREWYMEVAKCAHRIGDFDRLRFWVMDPSWNLDGRAHGQDIWIQQWYVDKRLLVEHEMLHTLGFHGHGDPAWARCGLYPLSAHDLSGDGTRHE